HPDPGGRCLQYLDERRDLLVLLGEQRYAEAAGNPALFQQFLREGEVLVPPGDRRSVHGRLEDRRKRAVVTDICIPLEEGLDERRAVEREGNRLADVLVRQRVGVVAHGYFAVRALPQRDDVVAVSQQLRAGVRGETAIAVNAACLERQRHRYL